MIPMMILSFQGNANDQLSPHLALESPPIPFHPHQCNLGPTVTLIWTHLLDQHLRLSSGTMIQTTLRPCRLDVLYLPNRLPLRKRNQRPTLVSLINAIHGLQKLPM